MKNVLAALTLAGLLGMLMASDAQATHKKKAACAPAPCAAPVVYQQPCPPPAPVCVPCPPPAPVCEQPCPAPKKGCKLFGGGGGLKLFGGHKSKVACAPAPACGTPVAYAHDTVTVGAVGYPSPQQFGAPQGLPMVGY